MEFVVNKVKQEVLKICWKESIHPVSLCAGQKIRIVFMPYQCNKSCDRLALLCVIGPNISGQKSDLRQKFKVYQICRFTNLWSNVNFHIK